MKDKDNIFVNNENIFLDKKNKKNIFSNFFSNKKIMSFILTLIFIFTSITVVKTFYYGNKVDQYEEVFINIEKKESSIIEMNMGNSINTSFIKDIAASDMISCINTSVDKNNLPHEILSVLNEIESFYNRSLNYFAFGYKDIYTGFTITYNPNQNIFTASTIKGPTDIYIYEMASQGKVDLNEKLMYTPYYYNTGSGTLKNNAFNTEYDIKTLLEYSTVISDNAAHNMLEDHFGRENMLSFWRALGTKDIFVADNNWGVTSVHDALIYMSELYDFSKRNEEYGGQLMINFLNASPKFISSPNNYKIANKSGWSGSVIHDVGIVFAENPYIVVELSNLGDTSEYQYYFDTVSELANRLHNEYWKYKMNICSKKQYQ